MKYVITLFTVLLFASCGKEEACETMATGTLCVENQTFSDIAIDIEGLGEFQVSANSTRCWEDVSAGVRDYFAIDRDITAVWDDQIDVRQCATTNIVLRK